jgi:hypothetical protein
LWLSQLLHFLLSQADSRPPVPGISEQSAVFRLSQRLNMQEIVKAPQIDGYSLG